MHISSLAPLLSAAANVVCIWIMGCSSFLLPRYCAARVTISTTRQFLVFDNGAHSVMRTRSPSLHSPFSSCACTLVERRTTLPYSGCCTWRSSSTVTVFVILLLTTRPSIVRCALFCSFIAVSPLLLRASGLLAEQRLDLRDFAL